MMSKFRISSICGPFSGSMLIVVSKTKYLHWTIDCEGRIIEVLWWRFSTQVLHVTFDFSTRGHPMMSGEGFWIFFPLSKAAKWSQIEAEGGGSWWWCVCYRFGKLVLEVSVTLLMKARHLSISRYINLLLHHDVHFAMSINNSCWFCTKWRSSGCILSASSVQLCSMFFRYYHSDQCILLQREQRHVVVAICFFVCWCS